MMQIMRTFIIASILFFSFVVIHAQNPFEISYPVVELGNCASQEECKAYCDNSDNHVVCMDWAASHGFATEGEANRVRVMREIQETGEMPDSYGPGGCKTPQECDAFCRIEENLRMCLQYSVANGYMPQEEMDKIIAKAEKGGPGGCKSKQECDSFCKNPDNVEQCMSFVVEEGKITREEADLMIQMAKNKDFGKPKGPKIDEQKGLEVLKATGGGPGGCKSNEECRAYCENTEHMQECMDFAVNHGLIPPEEAERAQKMMTMGGPGGCKNEQECDAFCGKEENRDTCFNFAKESGMISQEEIMMMEKQMQIIGKLETQAGPGGCRSQEECSAFCGDPNNLEQCANFASQSGMMRQDRAQMMVQQVQQMDQMKEFFMAPMMAPQNQMEGGQMMMPVEGVMPPEGCQDCQIPPEGMRFGPPPGFEGQMPPEGGMMPIMPEGMMPQGDFMQPPPSGEFMSPPSGSGGEMMGPPPGEMMAPPPSMDSVPPPSTESAPPPPTSWNSKSIMGVILGPFLDIFR